MMNCPACPIKNEDGSVLRPGRPHTQDEFFVHHPYARHGTMGGGKWTHPDLQAEYDQMMAAKKQGATV